MQRAVQIAEMGERATNSRLDSALERLGAAERAARQAERAAQQMEPEPEDESTLAQRHAQLRQLYEQSLRTPAIPAHTCTIILYIIVCGMCAGHSSRPVGAGRAKGGDQAGRRSAWSHQTICRKYL
jgi:hypothetical protein